MPVVIANQVDAEIQSRLLGITDANGYPFELKAVEVGKFYEDMADDAPLPVATLVTVTSGPVQGQQAQASGQRERQMQVEVVLDLGDYPGLERNEVLNSVEWSLCKAMGGPHLGRALNGRVLTAVVGVVEFDYPAPSHSVAIVRAPLTVSYVEQYG